MRYALITIFVIIGSVFVMQQVGVFPPFSMFFGGEETSKIFIEENQHRMSEEQSKESVDVPETNNEQTFQEAENPEEEIVIEESEETEEESAETQPGSPEPLPTETPEVSSPVSQPVEPVTTTPTTPNTPVVVTPPPVIEEPIQSEEIETDVCASLDIYAQSDCYGEQALLEDDPSLCAYIKTSEKLSFDCFSHFALERNDYTYCLQIGKMGVDFSYYQLDCIALYTEFSNNKTLCTDIYPGSDKTITRDSCYKTVASYTNDTGYCDYISETNQFFKDSCYDL